MRKLPMSMMGVLVSLLLPSLALAHTAVARCELKNEVVDCEAGFHDGSDAVGEHIKVFNYAGDVIAQGNLDKRSHFQFNLPREPFYILMDITRGEMFEVEWMDIVGMPVNQYPIKAASNP